MKPALSVIIPTRDTRDLTLRCLESLEREEGLGDLELIIVDDGSTDETAEAIADRWPEVRILSNREPAGFTASANRGLARATGEILLLLNSDTEVLPGGLTPLLETFRAEPRFGALGTQLYYPDGRAQWSGGKAPTLLWLFLLASGLGRALSRIPGYRRFRPQEAAELREVDWLHGAALAIRREAWEQAGPFDEGYRLYCQDLDLCTRLRERGWRVAIDPQARVLHHHGATIERTLGAVDRQSPADLWCDLLRWAAKHRSVTWVGTARTFLRSGGKLRSYLLAVPVPRGRGDWLDREARRRVLQVALTRLKGWKNPRVKRD